MSEQKLKRIPLARAREIAQEYGYEKVIILAITQRENRFQFWLTTYGKNKRLCAIAKKIGDFLIAVLCHPDLENDAESSVIQTLRKLKGESD